MPVFRKVETECSVRSAKLTRNTNISMNAEEHWHQVTTLDSTAS